MWFELAQRLRLTFDIDASAARKTLVAQHDQIRAHLHGCSALARRLRQGDSIHAEFDAALTQLRSDLMEHNTTEAELVRLLLRDSPDWGTRLVDRMLEEHVAEHAALWSMLEGSADKVAARMDDFIEDLDAHMAAEERTFLSPVVLRQDVITRHRRQEPT